MKRRMVAAVVVSLLLALAAFAKSKPEMLVKTDWLSAHSKDSKVVVIHVGRDRQAYEAGHIPNARFLALSEIAVTKNGIPNELPEPEKLRSVFEKLGVGNDKRVVLYGDHAGLYAARAYFTLDYLGVADKAALLDGGLEKWTAEARPVSKEEPTITPATLKIKPRPELVVSTAEVSKQLGPNTRIVDARPADEYSGAKSGDGVPRAGHIPGAKNVFWMDNLKSDKMPELKSPEEIRASYEKAGLKPGDKPIVYCRTGVQAAHDYFTLKLLGFDPVLYDGSFIEWSNTKDTPVEKQ